MKKILLIYILFQILTNGVLAKNENRDTIITTDGGITLYKNEQYYELIDNVYIDSEDFILKAENVTAFYKENIYDLIKFIAIGNASIKTTDNSTIEGDEIIYEIDSGFFSIKGNGMFNNGKLIVKSAEIKGEIKELNNKKYVNNVEAKDKNRVYIENQSMKSYSKSAVYNYDDDLLELFDEVKIMKDKEVTIGDYASINMTTNDYSIKSINNKVQLLISSEN